MSIYKICYYWNVYFSKLQKVIYSCCAHNRHCYAHTEDIFLFVPTCKGIKKSSNQVAKLLRFSFLLLPFSFFLFFELEICLATIALRIRHNVSLTASLPGWLSYSSLLLIDFDPRFSFQFQFQFHLVTQWRTKCQSFRARSNCVFPGVVAQRVSNLKGKNVTVESFAEAEEEDEEHWSLSTFVAYFCFYYAVTADFSAETWRLSRQQQQHRRKVKAKFRFNCFCFSIGLS